MSDWKMQREEVEKLIGAYRKLKCLWDFRSNEYKRHDLKKCAWQKLGNMFGKKAYEVKRKIKYLRCAYVSEKKKVDDSYGTSRIYRPNLFYYKDLNFLDSIIVCRKGPKFENATESIGEYNEQSVNNNFNEQYMEAADVVQPPSIPSPSQRKVESRLKIKKQHRLDPYFLKLDAAVSTLAEVTKTTSEHSIYTAFAKTIALQLSQLPPLDATATMSEIHQILSKNIIKSMLSKSRETIVEHVDNKLSVQRELSESRLIEMKHLPNDFEEVSI